MDFQEKKLIPSKYIYLFMAFICILLLFLSVVFGERFSPLKAVTSAVITPMQTGINGLGTKIYNDVSDKKTKKELIAENNELSKQLLDANALLQKYEQQGYEMKRLQKLLDLKESYPEYESVGAKVIATDSTNWFYTFVIDKGSDDGIKVGCNVLAGNGLAGIVTEVGTSYAKVRSIIDDNSNVSANVLGTDTLCTVSGDLTLISDGYIRVGYINKADEILEGAELVTSHVSDKFLPGLLIGYISDISVDANNLTQSAKCVPVVDFRNLQEVLVILTCKSEYKMNSKSKNIYDSISDTSSVEQSTAVEGTTEQSNSEQPESEETTSEESTSEETASEESTSEETTSEQTASEGE